MSPREEIAAAVRLCPNEDHGRPTRATHRLTWPDGRYRPVDACGGCRDFAVRQAVEEVHAITVTPIDEAFGECPVCTLPYPLRMDGTIRAHRSRFRRTCAGRGQKPKAKESQS